MQGGTLRTYVNEAKKHYDVVLIDCIGIWGRMHKDYLEQYHPAQYNDLILSGRLWTYLADLNEQAQNRLDCIISQMKEAEGITEELKSQDQMEWVRSMNSIRSRAEEIIRADMIYR